MAKADHQETDPPRERGGHSVPEAQRRAVQRARTEATAAHSIASDPCCDPHSAVQHLVVAWQTLLEALPDAYASSTPQAWLSQQYATASPHPDELTAQMLTWLERDSALVDQTPLGLPAKRGRAVILAHLRALRSGIELHDTAASRTRGSRRVVWIRRVAAWSIIGAVSFVVAVRPWELRRSGQWRGAYYPAEDFRGEPTVRRDRDVAFDWGLEPPMEDIPADRFGVRWDSCLTIKERTEAAFQLVSDDGSRLFINGELVIDNWKKHKPTARGEWITLDPGVHHLRVEYFEAEHEASIYLTASFDRKKRPDSIPAQLLKYPGGDLASSLPCAHP